MQGKVALDQHFELPEPLQDSADFVPQGDWGELKCRLLYLRDQTPQNRPRQCMKTV